MNQMEKPLSVTEIQAHLTSQTIGQTLLCLEQVDSTNLYLRRLAQDGATEGTTVLAECQTAGRGRLGRPFQSAPYKGIYLSILLRPDWPITDLFSITPMAAVAVCHGIEAVCGLRPQIKWPNDLMYQGKKLCGILSELELSPDSFMQSIILGIGINVNQQLCDFPEDLRTVATSLSLITGHPVSRVSLAAAVLQALDTYYVSFPRWQTDILQQYRAECNTLGQEITIKRNGQPGIIARAIDISDDFSLLVRLPDGSITSISSGEVSVRPTEP